MATQLNVRIPELTQSQLKELGEDTGMTQTQLVIMAIDRLYQDQRRKTMKNMNNANLKKKLGQGNILVWQDGNQTYIHHTNGVTLALNQQETVELLDWLKKQEEQKLPQ